ncbi:MAG: thiamine pyrophosphate-dependent enzyme, partial [Acidimicrobiia bacterium]
DGATSEGDFLEAMNFAGVFQVGVVFLCENNHYAISLNRAQQTRSDTIAQKAIAYGMPGIQVDGNDIFAVYQATLEAVERARAGGGPSLIEAVTYRLGPHTTSDDPARYRDAEEEEEWKAKDPLERVRRYLSARDGWSEEWQEVLDREAAEQIERAVELAEGLEPFRAEEIFLGMFEELTPALLHQQRDLVRGGE